MDERKGYVWLEIVHVVFVSVVVGVEVVALLLRLGKGRAVPALLLLLIILLRILSVVVLLIILPLVMIISAVSLS